MIKKQPESKPEAVCLIYKKNFNGKGLILSVSRKDNYNDYGLPGGKVDPGESLWEAMRRECIEETGYMPNDLIPVFSSDNYGYMVHTFTCKSLTPIGVAEEQGVVAWLSEEALIEKSSYSEYNKKLLEHLNAFTWHWWHCDWVHR